MAGAGILFRYTKRQGISLPLSKKIVWKNYLRKCQKVVNYGESNTLQPSAKFSEHEPQTQKDSSVAHDCVLRNKSAMAAPSSSIATRSWHTSGSISDMHMRASQWNRHENDVLVSPLPWHMLNRLVVQLEHLCSQTQLPCAWTIPTGSVSPGTPYIGQAI